MSGRLLREPLLHFALLGAGLFLVNGLLAQPVDTAEIVVSTERVTSLSAQFSAMRGGRLPTDAELRGLVEAYVRDEMLYREGLALGLDRDDPVVRGRIRQKMEILSTDALSVEPTDGELQAYLDAHREEFDIPGRLSFEQVYIDPAKHREPLDSVLTRVRGQLSRGRSPDVVGDRTMLPHSMVQVMPTEVSTRFGEAFETQLGHVGQGGWHGPLATPFGVHLVRVTRREPATRATLTNARDVVLREWTRAHTEMMKERYYRDLATRYTVRHESTPPVEQVAANESAR